jgi:outer membrane protein OmpA-like peptidoglycan-associated protein
MKLSRCGQAVALACLLGACSSTPIQPHPYEQAREAYQRASDNPQVARLAPNELDQAQLALKQVKEAKDEHAEDEQVLRLAHIARQKVAIAEEVAKRRLAEAQLAETSRERDRLVAAKRSAEVQRAQQTAIAARQHAQQLEAQLRELQAKNSERGTVISIDNLVFGTGSAQVNPGGVLKLRKLADILVQNPDRDVLVEGFTDSIGDEAFNKDLSERRAQAIRATLIEMGVASDRIAIRGYGESFPVADNDTPAGRQMNRRVEIVIAEDTSQIAPRVASTAR